MNSALLANALLAYSVHEHQLGHVQALELWLEPGSLTLHDDGRGMGLDRPGYVSSLFATVLGGHEPVQLHGVGLSLVAASTPELKVEACRAGTWWQQSFRRGIAADEPVRLGPCSTSGTRISASGMQPMSSAELALVVAQVEAWRAANPALRINVHLGPGYASSSNGA